MKHLLLSLFILSLSLSSRALTLQDTYQAQGTNAVGKQQSWTMQAVMVSQTEAQLINMLPSQLGQDVALTCQIQQQSLIIRPQLISHNATLGWYMFAFSPDSPDGSLTLQVDSRSQILGSYSLTYGVFTTPEFDASFGSTYVGYHTALTQITYTTQPTECTEAHSSFIIEGLPLYACMAADGSALPDNHIIVPAFTPLTFLNSADGNEAEVLDAPAGATYSDHTLTSSCGSADCPPYVFGAATGQFSHSLIHVGGAASQFLTPSGSQSILSAFNPDTRLTFYNNWGTPDIARTPMSRIISHHPCPSAPLYVEGVSLPLARASFADDFRLHLTISRCSWRGSEPQVGEVLAEADATLPDVDQSHLADGGLALVRFSNLYRRLGDGSLVSLHHLFLDDEFLVTISDWDNLIFSGIIGASDISLCDASQPVSTWFESTSQPGSLLTYQQWPTRLFIGFLGAAYGYLLPLDNDNDNPQQPLPNPQHPLPNTQQPLPISFPAEGGEQTLRIHPMLTTTNPDGSPRTLLYFQDRAQIPDWLTASIVSEDYSNHNSEFSLRIRVSPGPAATARLVIWQPGARLELSVTRGEVSSIDNLQYIIDNSSSSRRTKGVAKFAIINSQLSIINSQFIISSPSRAIEGVSLAGHLLLNH